MKKWTLLDSVRTPEGKTISLHEHDGHYTLRINGLDLMSTRQHSSEEKLAELACQKLVLKKKARVLIGGLGLGFTLKKTLSYLRQDAKVVVAEIIPAVIHWNKNPEINLSGTALADPRVQVVQRDVADLIRDGKSHFDAILLDVDNGPASLTTDRNRRLYQKTGLMQAFDALRDGGCLAVWSANADPSFQKLMGQVGFSVQLERSRAYKDSGSSHSLFIGRKAEAKQISGKKSGRNSLKKGKKR